MLALGRPTKWVFLNIMEFVKNLGLHTIMNIGVHISVCTYEL